MRRLHAVTFVVAVLGVIPATARQARPPDRVQAQPIFTDDPTRGVSTVPVGAKVDVRLQTAIDSSIAKIDQRFDATTMTNYVQDGRVVIPGVTPVRGFVSSVRASTPANRTGSLTLSFDGLKIGDQSLPLRASIEQVFSGRNDEVSTRIVPDATVSAAMSRVPGADQVLFVGVTILGGSIVSTEAADVRLPAGTAFRIRIDKALQIAGGR